jgi:hypothetical protein
VVPLSQVNAEPVPSATTAPAADPTPEDEPEDEEPPAREAAAFLPQGAKSFDEFLLAVQEEIATREEIERA